MALREFRDADGVEWRVWQTIPKTSALVRLDYGPLGPLEAGWLTFESAGERRRLTPVPADWDNLSDAALERCCKNAKAPPARRSGAGDPARSNASRASLELSPLDPATPARTFTGASGRSWRVTEQERTVRTPAGGTGAERVVTYFVLRFTSEEEARELRTYPMAWARLADAQLMGLAREAEPVRDS